MLEQTSGSQVGVLDPVTPQVSKASIAEIEKLAAESKKFFNNDLAEFIFYRTYSRWMPEKGRRETWVETVQRFMDFMRENLGEKLPENDYADVHKALLNMEIVPSMRLMWGSGPAVRKTNVVAYNCSFIAPSKPEDFAEIMYVLMCGTGVGFSVEKQTVDLLPKIAVQSGKKLKTYIVPDSKEGWADALKHGMETWFNGMDVDFDYSLLRPAGARLKTMGGHSSGPQPLINLMEFAREVILKKQGKRLSTLEVHDICCKIGEIVVSGGVRRSAMISLSDLNDEEMRFAKHGEFWNTNPERMMSNNSAVYEEKPTWEEFSAEWKALKESGTGERGIFNRGSLQTQLPERRWNVFKEFAATCGTNPCGEIVLRSKQFCNLTSIVARAEDTAEDFKRKIRLATILGTYQATLTNFPYLSKEWTDNSRAEALLGVSITGVWDAPQIQNAALLDELREHSIEVNKEYSLMFGINASTCVTCIKPSGNSSQLLDTSSGLHPRHSEYYIRRVRISAEDPLFKMLKQQGVPYHPEIGQDPKNASAYVLEFPVKSPVATAYRDDLSAIKQLEIWKLFKKHFTEHNPSVTISIGEAEWDDAAKWIYENWDYVGGLSFLPRDNAVYKLAPYETITKKQYEEMVKSFPKVDYGKILSSEIEDNTAGAKELACVSGTCEVV